MAQQAAEDIKEAIVEGASVVTAKLQDKVDYITGRAVDIMLCENCKSEQTANTVYEAGSRDSIPSSTENSVCVKCGARIVYRRISDSVGYVRENAPVAAAAAQDLVQSAVATTMLIPGQVHQIAESTRTKAESAIARGKEVAEKMKEEVHALPDTASNVAEEATEVVVNTVSATGRSVVRTLTNIIEDVRHPERD